MNTFLIIDKKNQLIFLWKVIWVIKITIKSKVQCKKILYKIFYAL